MAKARRWLVRGDNGIYQVIERQRTPRKPVTGWANWRGFPKNHSLQGCVWIMLPESLRLPPGGGPVELKT